MFDSAPLATPAPPITSAQPTTRPSAVLVIGLTVPPRNLVLACAGNCCMTLLALRAIGGGNSSRVKPLDDSAVCLTVRDCRARRLGGESNGYADRCGDRQLRWGPSRPCRAHPYCASIRTRSTRRRSDVLAAPHVGDSSRSSSAPAYFAGAS